MRLIRLYSRVLGALRREAGLAGTLALANAALPAAAFAEPVLFGRAIDALSASTTAEAAWPRLSLLLSLWLGFDLFNIACSTLVALFADRLAHRHRRCVMADFFECALELPLACHSETHSGRLLKDHASRHRFDVGPVARLLAAITLPDSYRSSSCCRSRWS